MQDFINATPTQDAQTENMLTFNYNNLQPFQQNTIDIALNTFAPPIVNGGETLNFSASITPNNSDYTPSDNTHTIQQPVVNSFDPNDKTCLEGDSITIDQASEYLHYRIRFQNTGTASAINIIVTDELDDKLDWNSFKPIASSHNYRTQITNGRFVDFIFENINLPDSSSDEAHSHGYIAFKIKPKANAQLGDIITGKANIFFDFNLPIETNVVSTEIVPTLSSNNIYKVYPNPATNYITIESEIAMNSFEVYDINGRLLKTIMPTRSQSQIDISDLVQGIYLLEMQANEMVYTEKIIKK